MEISDDLRQKLHLISDFSRIAGENSIYTVDSLSRMEKSSALLLRPERDSANNQIVKACAAQQGVDHIDRFLLMFDKWFFILFNLHDGRTF